MRIHTTAKLSEHIDLTPEGYLYCRGVALARTGVMEYLRDEVPPEVEAARKNSRPRSVITRGEVHCSICKKIARRGLQPCLFIHSPLLLRLPDAVAADGVILRREFHADVAPLGLHTRHAHRAAPQLWCPPMRLPRSLAAQIHTRQNAVPRRGCARAGGGDAGGGKPW